MLIDDDAEGLSRYAALLGQRGYVVAGAMSMTEARRLCGQQTFDVLITDIRLQDGDGLTLMQALQAHCGGLRGIAMSRVATPADIEESKAAGFAAHLIKPVDLPDLEAAVAKVLALE